MRKIFFTLFIALLATNYTNAQINLKKKAEKKANQTIDDFLFGKKKKKNGSGSEDVNSSSGTSSSGEVGSGGEVDDYTPEPVDFGSLDLTKSIDFRILMNMLPERTQGFSRQGKPQGARYSTQGVSYSTASKDYTNGDREMTITLNDYLGAEFIATAQSAQQFEYESTDGYAKSIEVDGVPGWISYDYSDKSGTLFLYLDERFYTTVNADNTNEAELKAAAADVKLARLKSKISE